MKNLIKELAIDYIRQAAVLQAHEMRLARESGKKIKVGPFADELSDAEFDELESAILVITEGLE